jgi:hypothetical protein
MTDLQNYINMLTISHTTFAFWAEGYEYVVVESLTEGNPIIVAIFKDSKFISINTYMDYKTIQEFLDS